MKREVLADLQAASLAYATPSLLDEFSGIKFNRWRKWNGKHSNLWILNEFIFSISFKKRWRSLKNLFEGHLLFGICKTLSFISFPRNIHLFHFHSSSTTNTDSSRKISDFLPILNFRNYGAKKPQRIGIPAFNEVCSISLTVI